MEIAGKSTTVTVRRGVVIVVLASAIVAQGFYVWSFDLTFWPGPGRSPTVEQGLLISQVTSGVLLVLAVATVVLARAVPLGIVMGVWALLLLMNNALWLFIGVPGLIAVLVVGVIQLVRLRRDAGAAS